MTIRERFEKLKIFAEGYTSCLEKELQKHTGIGNFRIYVHDEFIAAFPEDHVTRSGHVMISLRLTIDLKGLGAISVSEVKRRLIPISEHLRILRPNFADSQEEVDFDWHVSESEREKDEGKEFANRLRVDTESLSVALRTMLQAGDEKPKS